MKMKAFEEIDYFTDRSLAGNSNTYFEQLRAQGPAVRLPNRAVIAVTGYEEGLATLRNEERFSSFNAAYGPHPLPFEPEGEDITEQIEAHRGAAPIFRMISTFDPPDHTKLRFLLQGLITPNRIKANEEFMWRLADELIDEFYHGDSFEIISQFALAFATLVIADLLGVPEEDHQAFRTLFSARKLGVGSLEGPGRPEDNPLPKIEGHFVRYIEDRRANPRKDVLTDLAFSKYPDGSLPAAAEVASLAAFLFAAGQEATVRFAASMLLILGEDLELQQRLRADRSLIPNFIEEALRLESAVKTGFRLTKVRAKVGDEDMAPGTTVMLCLTAMNRDPKRFENPNAFQPERKNARDHLAFGRGVHSCIGAPLARAELRVTLERLFDRTADIRIDETQHGPAGSRTFHYAESYQVHGPTELHLNFSPKS
jgi:cytochrome P450